MLEHSKKSASNFFLHITDQEKNNLLLSINLPAAIYNFHLDLAMKIFIDKIDFCLDIDYTAFLRYLYLNYQMESSSSFFFKSFIFSFPKKLISPKSANDFMNFIKKNCENYGFLKRELHHSTNLLIANDPHFDTLRNFEFLVLFDQIDEFEIENRKKKINELEVANFIDGTQTYYYYILFSFQSII